MGVIGFVTTKIGKIRLFWERKSNHRSLVTHYGWNLVLESVVAGVPMVAWPLYAEQRFNKTMLVEELKLALPMNESKGGLVSVAEVERQVRVMETHVQVQGHG